MVVIVGFQNGNIGRQNIVNSVFMGIQNNNIGDGVFWVQNSNTVPGDVLGLDRDGAHCRMEVSGFVTKRSYEWCVAQQMPMFLII